MQFVITAYDGEGMLDKRMEVRPRHLEGMERLKNHIVCAGGLLDEEGHLKGSVLVMEFQSREEVDEYIRFFNEERPAYSLNYLTPKQFKEQYGQF